MEMVTAMMQGLNSAGSRPTRLFWTLQVFCLVFVLFHEGKPAERNSKKAGTNLICSTGYECPVVIYRPERHFSQIRQ